MDSTFLALASKAAFNKALRHFLKVNEVVDDVESNKNLADLINVQLENGEMVEEQVLPAVGAIIRDKYGYTYDSYNLPVDITEYGRIVEEISKWTALDIVLVYYDPNGKTFLINPRNINHWIKTRELHHDQLLVIYVKHLKGQDKKIEKEAVAAISELLAGKDIFVNKEFVDATVVAKAPPAVKPEPAQVQAATSKNVTPKYGVRVSNELFHNGNVEAWKKIVESYTTKYPELKVHIFFEGEVINDINSLFKWGKVKHGDSIFFQVSGNEIKGVSKLQKYLFEGASQRYEQFLKIGIGQVLNLF
jgi:hypothetical protein